MTLSDLRALVRAGAVSEVIVFRSVIIWPGRWSVRVVARSGVSEVLCTAQGHEREFSELPTVHKNLVRCGIFDYRVEDKPLMMVDGAHAPGWEAHAH